MLPLHPLRLNPPDARSSNHPATMGSNTPFVVRLLPSTGLDGAFRVHLSPEGLERLDLKVGELCQITGENGGIGYGIAWRATDKMGNSPRLRPAKMTDTLRTTFDFKEGKHVTISRTSTQIMHANKVTLTDVTPSDYGNAADSDNGRWGLACGYLLGFSEAVAVGTTFDVTAKKGLRKRFYVDHITSTGGQTNTPALFYCDDRTQITFSDAMHATEAEFQPALPDGDSFPVLDTTRIGGLVEQVKELNKRLERIIDRSKQAKQMGSHVAWNRHVLLYGYEGTGKSLLLDRLEQTSACKVFRIEKVDLPIGKIQSTIQSTFKEAVARQPSVILMDDVDKIAPSDNDPYARLIGRELDKLSGTNVLVIAATRSIASIDSKLIGPGRLSKKIELAIPDVAARKQILNVMLNKPANLDDPVTAFTSMKTHGFTGKDIGLLVEEASDHAIDRSVSEREDWVSVHARVPVHNGVVDGQLDGSLHSQATTEVEQATQQLAYAVADADGEQQEPMVTVEDFELALTEVRPTALREIILETPKIQWSDIGGSEANKQRFDEIIGWPLHHPEIMEHLDPKKGVLLYGPPGCSKTMTAQAVATTYDLNFIAVKGAELISMYVGESERAVREIFRKARQAAPCIIFFDEIDAIGSERESGGTKGLNVLTTLLNEMDGFEAMKDVLVLAATNKPEVLDPALLRPGRFDNHVYVGLPNDAARRDILELSLRKQLARATDLDIEMLVSDTEGYSGAEVVAVCQTAKRCAARRTILAGDSSDIELCARDFELATGEVGKGVTSEMLDDYQAFRSR